MGNSCCYTEERSLKGDSSAERAMIFEMQRNMKALEHRIREMEQERSELLLNRSKQNSESQRPQLTASGIRFSPVKDKPENNMLQEDEDSSDNSDDGDSDGSHDIYTKKQPSSKRHQQIKQLDDDQESYDPVLNRFKQTSNINNYNLNENSGIRKRQLELELDDDALSLNQAAIDLQSNRASDNFIPRDFQFGAQTTKYTQQQQIHFEDSARKSENVGPNMTPRMSENVANKLSPRKYQNIDMLSNDTYLVSVKESTYNQNQMDLQQNSVTSQVFNNNNFGQEQSQSSKPRFNFALPLDKLNNEISFSNQKIQSTTVAAEPQIQISASPSSYPVDQLNRDQHQDSKSPIINNFMSPTSNDDDNVSIQLASNEAKSTAKSTISQLTSDQQKISTYSPQQNQSDLLNNAHRTKNQNDDYTQLDSNREAEFRKENVVQSINDTDIESQIEKLRQKMAKAQNQSDLDKI